MVDREFNRQLLTKALTSYETAKDPVLKKVLGNYIDRQTQKVRENLVRER